MYTPDQHLFTDTAYRRASLEASPQKKRRRKKKVSMKEGGRGMRRSSLIQVCFCTYPAVLRLWLRRTTPSCSAGVQSQNSSQTLRHLSSTAGEIEIEIEKGEEKKEGHMISTLAQAWCRHGSSRRQNIKDHFKKSFRGARARERETGRQRQTERQMKGENKCFFCFAL